MAEPPRQAAGPGLTVDTSAHGKGNNPKGNPGESADGDGAPGLAIVTSSASGVASGDGGGGTAGGGALSIDTTVSPTAGDDHGGSGVRRPRSSRAEKGKDGNRTPRSRSKSPRPGRPRSKSPQTRFQKPLAITTPEELSAGISGLKMVKPRGAPTHGHYKGTSKSKSSPSKRLHRGSVFDSNSVTKRFSTPVAGSSEPALEGVGEGDSADEDETAVASKSHTTSAYVSSGDYAWTGEEDDEGPQEPTALSKQRSDPSHRRSRSQGSSHGGARRASVGGASKGRRKSQVAFLTQRDLEDRRMWQEEEEAAKERRGPSPKLKRTVSWKEQGAASDEESNEPVEHDAADYSQGREMRSQPSQESQESLELGHGDDTRHNDGGGSGGDGGEGEGAAQPDRRPSVFEGNNPMRRRRRSSSGRRRSSTSSSGSGRRRSSLVSTGSRRSSVESLDGGGSGSSVNVVALCELVNNANGVDPVAAESALRGVILLAGMDTIQRLSLGKYGACRAAVGALEHFPEDAAVAASACAAIMNLAFESNNEMMLGMEGACKAVVKALARHPGDRQVQVEGWGAVVNLASINIERFLTAGVCEVVTSSMRTLATGAIDDGWVEPVMAELLIALLTVCGHSSSLVELGKSGVCEALVDMLGFYKLGVDDTSVDAEGGDDPFGNAAVMPETGRFKWDAADFTARGTDSTDNTAAPATTNTDTNPDNNAGTDTDANTEPPRRWPFSERISRLGCRALAALSEHAPNRARLANAEAVRHAVFALVALHGRSEELRSDALNCMINLVQECSCTEELAAPPPAVDHRGGGGECDAIEHSGGGGGVGGGGVCATTCARVDATEAGGLEAVSVAMSAAPNDPLVQRQASIAVILMCTGNGAIKRRLVVEASGTGADSSGMRQRSSTIGTRASVTTHAQFVAELAARVEASGVLTCVVAALQGHPTDLRIVEAACMALAAAAELSPSVARALNKLDACTALGAAMRAYPENDLIQDHSVRALLPVLSHGRGELAKWKVAASVELLCGVTLAALERFMDVPDMQECILNVISELAHTSEAHRACIHTIGIAERLVYSMRARVSHIAIQKSASVAIANLCVFDSSTAGDSKAGSTIKEGGLREALVSCGACEAVVAAIRQYSTDRELLLLAFPALWHLAEEDVTTIGRLRAIETQELVAQIRPCFVMDPEVMEVLTITSSMLFGAAEAQSSKSAAVATPSTPTATATATPIPIAIPIVGEDSRALHALSAADSPLPPNPGLPIPSPTPSSPPTSPSPSRRTGASVNTPNTPNAANSSAAIAARRRASIRRRSASGAGALNIPEGFGGGSGGGGLVGSPRTSRASSRRDSISSLSSAGPRTAASSISSLSSVSTAGVSVTDGGLGNRYGRTSSVASRRRRASSLFSLESAQSSVMSKANTYDMDQGLEVVKQLRGTIGRHSSGVAAMLDRLVKATKGTTASCDASRFALRDGGLCDAIPTAMRAHEGHLKIQRAGAALAVNMSQDEASCAALGDAGCCQAVVAAMRRHANDLPVQQEGARAIFHLTRDGGTSAAHNFEYLQSVGVVEVLMITLRTHTHTHQLQDVGLHALCVLGVHEPHRKLMQQSGVCQAIVRSLRVHSNISNIQRHGLSVIFLLANGDTEMKSELGEAGVCEAVVLALEAHLADLDVVEGGCAVAMAMAQGHDHNQNLFRAAGIFPALCRVMEVHRSIAGVQEDACAALCSLCEQNEESQYEAFKAGSCKHLLAAMRHFEHDAHVQTQACAAVRSLSARITSHTMDSEIDVSDEIAVALLRGGIMQLLPKVASHFPDSDRGGQRAHGVDATTEHGEHSDSDSDEEGEGRETETSPLPQLIADVTQILELHQHSHAQTRSHTMSSPQGKAKPYFGRQASAPLSTATSSAPGEFSSSAHRATMLGRSTSLNRGVMALSRSRSQRRPNGEAANTTDKQKAVDPQLLVAALNVGLEMTNLDMSSDRDMGKYKGHDEVVKGLTAVREAAMDDAVACAGLGKAGACAAVVSIMTSHVMDVEVQVLACGAIVSLAADDGNQRLLGEADASQALVRMFGTFPKHRRLQEDGCRAVASLAVNSDTNRGLLRDAGANEYVVMAMHAHVGSASLQVAGASTICILVHKSPLNVERVVRVGGVEAVAAAMKRHGGSALVCQQCAMACRRLIATTTFNNASSPSSFSSTSSLSPSSASTTSSSPVSKVWSSGLAGLVVAAMRDHETVVNIQLQGAACVLKLAVDDDTRTRVAKIGACAALESAVRHHPANGPLVQVAVDAIAAMMVDHRENVERFIEAGTLDAILEAESTAARAHSVRGGAPPVGGGAVIWVKKKLRGEGGGLFMGLGLGLGAGLFCRSPDPSAKSDLPCSPFGPDSPLVLRAGVPPAPPVPGKSTGTQVSGAGPAGFLGFCASFGRN